MSVTDTKDRRLVRRVLLAFMRELRAILRRQAPAYYAANPDAPRPCHSCAFNPATDRWAGMETTANTLRQAIAGGRQFNCHQGFPWRTPMHEWSDKDLRRMLLDPTPCAGYKVCMQAPASELRGAFELAARKELQDAE